jgi:tRNA A37 threonylcarbamoyladenosine dehydratase
LFRHRHFTQVIGLEEKMNEDLYNRQAKIGLSVPDRVVVAGCGGVGAWVALEFALAGTQSFVLFDNDQLADHNRNRLPFANDKVGENKVDVVRDFINIFRPDTNITVFNKQFDEAILRLIKFNPNLVVDCTDNLDSQKEICQWAKKQNIKYIRVGVTTNHITVASDMSVWENKKDKSDRNTRTCGTIVPAWVGPCALAASLAVIKASLNNEMEVSLDVTNIKKLIC